jgi:hypothetical protein
LRLSLPGAQYDSPQRIAAFADDLLEPGPRHERRTASGASRAGDRYSRGAGGNPADEVPPFRGTPAVPVEFQPRFCLSFGSGAGSQLDPRRSRLTGRPATALRQE